MSVKFLEIDNLTEQTSNSTLAKPNISALTGLRFIAAFMVFICHSPKPAWLLQNTPGNLTVLGYAGVALFFVLSGFVITLNYYDWFATGKALSKVKSYAVARFARIYPVYFFAFIVVFFTEPSVILPVTVGIDPLPGLLHLSMLQAWNSNFLTSLAYNGVAWSVSVEIFFYFTFPFVAKFLLPRFKTLFSLGLAATLTVVTVLGIEAYLWIDILFHGNPDTAIYLVYIFPPLRFFDFLLGCLLARIYFKLRERPVTSRERKFATIGLVVNLILATLIWINFDTAWGLFYYDAAFIAFFGYIIFYLARYPVTGIFGFLTDKRFILLGEASYSFYLMHHYLLVITHGRVKDDESFFFYVTYEAILLCLSIFLSISIYKFIEVPARRYIRQKWG